MSKPLNPLDEQRFLRQQLALSVVHADCLQSASDELHRRAFKQASLGCLDIGLRFYLAAALALSTTLRLSEFGRASVDSVIDDFKQEELLLLLGDSTSWLSELALIIDSLMTRESPAPDLAPPVVASSSDIIGRSADAVVHWVQLSSPQLEFFHSKVHELVERHSEQGIEY